MAANEAPAEVPVHHTDSTDDSTRHNDEDLERQQKIEEAIDEGHDADIPSNLGYVLDDDGELKRQKSIADRRRNSLARKRSRASEDIEKEAGKEPEKEEEAATSDDEANVVWWDGDDDPANPYNWPEWRKWMNCGMISFLTFITPLASCMSAPMTILTL